MTTNLNEWKLVLRARVLWPRNTSKFQSSPRGTRHRRPHFEQAGIQEDERLSELLGSATPASLSRRRQSARHDVLAAGADQLGRRCLRASRLIELVVQPKLGRVDAVEGVARAE